MDRDEQLLELARAYAAAAVEALLAADLAPEQHAPCTEQREARSR